jgi:membrane-associated phospholipid phosphatase
MLLNSRTGLFALLLLVFLVNYGETWLERPAPGQPPVSSAAYNNAYSFQAFERGAVEFEFHDRTALWGVYAYSIAYFAVFPALAIGLLFGLARRRELAPFRVLCLAVTIDYLVSLPFFLLYPVPERWSYPESRAVLLSDLWSSNLIQAIRPISALNNCVPSTHVSLTVIIVAVCWLFQVRYRLTFTALGLTVVLATFVLGIHWLPDMIAGLMAGLGSVLAAWRFTDTTERRELALGIS